MKALERVPFVSLGPGLRTAEIAEGERRISLPVPETYRAFLAETNGARLERGVYVAPGTLLDVRTLAGIRPRGSGVDPADLAGWYERFGKSKIGPPAGAFQFASAPSGDFVVFAKGRRRGEVHYIDRETRKRTRLTRSLDDFFRGLRVRDAVHVAGLRPVRTKKPSAKRPTPKAKRIVEATTFEASRPVVRIRDVRAIDCAFVDCAPRATGFSTFERLDLVRPVCRTKLLSRAILRDIVVDGATIRVRPNASNVFSLVNCLFDRVTLAGDIRGGLFLRTDLYGLTPADKRRIQTFYDDVEWALDIRSARFRNLTVRGVPGHLVKRDPSRHILIRSDRLAQDHSWRTWRRGLVAVLEHALESPDDWHFYSANELSPKFREALADVKRLRQTGLGE